MRTTNGKPMWRWRQGGRWGRHDIDRVGMALIAVGEEHGDLNAEWVVRAARRKDSPLHACFNWDDKAAAHEYRKEQARSLIRSIIVDEERNGETYEVPYFPHVEAADERPPEYITITDLMEGPVERRDRYLDLVLREAEAFMRKHAAVSELSGVFRAIQTARRRFEKARQRCKPKGKEERPEA
jgi:hypothetical protein